MAKFLGAPTSGSQANTTYSRNKGGQYTRNRSIPVNPRTPAQTSARNLLGAAASAWRDLEFENQILWNDYAATQPKLNSLGATFFWSGMQTFVECYIVKLGIGEAVPVTPPADVTFAPLTIGATISAAGPSLEVSFSPTAVDTGFVLQFDLTTARSAGVTFFGPSDFRRVANLPAATATGEDIFTDYSAVFGAFGPVGNVIGMRARLISITGCAGPWVQVRIDILA